MRSYIRTDFTSPEMAAKLSSVETRANAAIAIAIVVIGTQIVLAVFMFKIWLNARPSRRQSDDVERGLELDNVPRNAATDTRPRRPRAPDTSSPVGPTPTEARGRPVAAYGHVDGESESYYTSAPLSGGRRPSRQPTWTADSGLGQQTHGANYSQQKREARHGSDAHHRTNTNDANYGRRGNKFAHGN